MRVAVTGAAGYLGRPIVEALARDDRVDSVVAIDLLPLAPADGVEPLRRDVRELSAEDLADVDVLVHLAARVLGRGGDAWSVNVEGSRTAFEASLRAGARAIVHASSGAAYGSAPDNPVPLTEDSPLRPEPPFYYPQTKVEVEGMLDELERREPELRVVRMRPVSALGRGAPVMLRGRTWISLSDYDPLIQFVWLDDVVDAFVRAVHQPVSGPFNVGAPDPVRVSEVGELLGARSVRLPHRVVRLAARLPGGGMHPAWVDVLRYPIVVDCSRAERELGWRASCDCRAALRRFGPLLRGDAGGPAPVMQGEAAT